MTKSGSQSDADVICLTPRRPRSPKQINEVITYNFGTGKKFTSDRDPKQPFVQPLMLSTQSSQTPNPQTPTKPKKDTRVYFGNTVISKY